MKAPTQIGAFVVFREIDPFAIFWESSHSTFETAKNRPSGSVLSKIVKARWRACMSWPAQSRSWVLRRAVRCVSALSAETAHAVSVSHPDAMKSNMTRRITVVIHDQTLLCLQAAARQLQRRARR